MPEITSIGKYCPNCNLMTSLSQGTCERCGHHFRSGEPVSSAETTTHDADPLNKTQMFMRSPISTSAVYSLSETHIQGADHKTERAINRPKNLHWAANRSVIAGLLIAGLVIMAGVVSGWFLWTSWRKPPQFPVAIDGTWESDAPSAQVKLKFVGNGNGSFSWNSSTPQEISMSPNKDIESAIPNSGKTTLKWQQDTDRHLNLAIQPSAAAGTVPGALIEALNGHPWDWHVDGASNTLKIGPLPFKRIKDEPSLP